MISDSNEISPADIGENRRKPQVSGVYKKRYKTQVEACAKLDFPEFSEENNKPIIRNHIIVNQKHKILFRWLEKVGCTFWKRVLQIIAGNRKERNPYHILPSSAHSRRLETVPDMPFYDNPDIFSNFKKIIFVRDPYDRLFSAYVDKIFSPTVRLFPFRRLIASLTRQNVSTSSMGCAPSITFAEFVKYVIYSIKTGRDRESHFTPMYESCRPCQLRYDVIAKMENFSIDTKYVIQLARLDKLVDVSLDKQDVEKDDIYDKIILLYKRRNKIEKCMLFGEAIRLTWRNLQIRGVISKHLDLPQNFLQNNNFRQKDLTKVLISAYSMSDVESKKANRKEALLEAYRTVPMEDLVEIKRLFRADFEIFGYDIDRSDIYKNAAPELEFSYFRVD